MDAPPLQVAPVEYRLAKYAVENWHYSKSYPAGISVRLGVWEHGRYIGCVLFGGGVNKNLARPFGVERQEVMELCRVALTTHEYPVTQMVAEGLRLVAQLKPDVRVVVSYADPAQGHEGGIYRAGNWIYLGRGRARGWPVVHGKTYHPRMCFNVYGTSSMAKLRAIDPDVHTVYRPSKHKFAWPMDSQMRRRIKRMALPYPPAVEVLEETRLPA